MSTQITIISDDQKDADVIAVEIANHMAGRGFKNVHYHTSEEDGHIFNYAQEQLQAAHDASVEDSPSLLDLMRLSRPEFFAEEDIEVRSEPSMFGDIVEEITKDAPVLALERAERFVANELVLEDEPDDETKAVVKRARELARKSGNGSMEIDKAVKQLKKEGVIGQFSQAGLGATVEAMKDLMATHFPETDVKWYTKPGDGERSLNDLYGDPKKEIDITNQAF